MSECNSKFNCWLICSYLFGGLHTGCNNYTQAKLSQAAKTDLFQSLVQQDIGFFDARKTGILFKRFCGDFQKAYLNCCGKNSGEIKSRLTSDCAIMTHRLSWVLTESVRNVITLMATIMFMVKMSWQLSVISVISFPMIVLVTKIVGRYSEVMLYFLQGLSYQYQFNFCSRS